MYVYEVVVFDKLCGDVFASLLLMSLVEVEAVLRSD